MPAEESFKITPLDTSIHQREEFDCGVGSLNNYLAKQARLDVKRSAAGCWVLIESDDPTKIIGYYTISTAAVLAEELDTVPQTTRKHFPNYPQIGALLLGRLAVALKRHGQGLGGILLIDAPAHARGGRLAQIIATTCCPNHSPLTSDNAFLREPHWRVIS